MIWQKSKGRSTGPCGEPGERRRLLCPSTGSLRLTRDSTASPWSAGGQRLPGWRCCQHVWQWEAVSDTKMEGQHQTASWAGQWEPPWRWRRRERWRPELVWDHVDGLHSLEGLCVHAHVHYHITFMYGLDAIVLLVLNYVHVFSMTMSMSHWGRQGEFLNDKKHF